MFYSTDRIDLKNEDEIIYPSCKRIALKTMNDEKEWYCFHCNCFWKYEYSNVTTSGYTKKFLIKIKQPYN